MRVRLPDQEVELLTAYAATLLSTYGVGDSLASRLAEYVCKHHLTVSEEQQQAIIFLINEAHTQRYDQFENNHGCHLQHGR